MRNDTSNSGHTDASELAESTAAPGEVVTVARPGGAIALRDGQPINPLSVQEAAAASLAVIGEGLGWLAVLLHTAASLEPGGDVEVMSEWAKAEPTKHAAYVEWLRGEIDAAFPYVWPLLCASRATVAINPGDFSFCTPAHLGIAFSAPQLARFTYLHPFAVADGETSH